MLPSLAVVWPSAVSDHTTISAMASLMSTYARPHERSIAHGKKRKKRDGGAHLTGNERIQAANHLLMPNLRLTRKLERGDGPRGRADELEHALRQLLGLVRHLPRSKIGTRESGTDGNCRRFTVKTQHFLTVDFGAMGASMQYCAAKE